MADKPVVHIGENSPEQIAYKLLQSIAAHERKLLFHTSKAPADADRKWLLDTYAECLDTVKGRRSYANDKNSSGGIY